MLGQIADHSRIVNPTPSDDYVRQRREAAEKLVNDESLPVETLETFVEFAVFGVPSSRGEQQEFATESLITAIREFQPSFAGDVDANQLELRLVAAIVIGERVRSEPSDPINVYLASLLIGALLLQPLPAEVYIARLIEDLVEVAKASLRKASNAVRARRPWPNKSSVDITGDDHTAVALSAKKAFDVLLGAITSNAAADREELDVLWWVFGGRSARTGERFQSMTDGERVFNAAIELSDRMLMPPISTAQQLLSSLVSDQSQVSLTNLVGQVTKETLIALVEKKKGVETVLESQPCILPLSWLATRLLASDFSPGWQHEFEKKTKLKADTPAVPGDWARQVFAESVAQRLALPLLADESPK
jgi:hypothetical protein